MATTTNYGWETPDDTDLVKDGALAQRTTASAIDTSLFSITGGKNVGAQFISATTFTGVTAFTVSNCFTSAYDNYIILFNATAGTANTEVRCQLDASGTPSNANYAWAGFGAATGTSAASNDSSNSNSYHPVTFIPGTSATEAIMTIGNPQDATYTTLGSMWLYDDGGTLISRNYVGRHRANTSYNGIRFFNPATMTGTVKVYGLRDS